MSRPISSIPRVSKSIAPALAALGFSKMPGGRVFARARPGTDEHEVFWLSSHAKWSYPAVAKSFRIEAGVSLDPASPADLRATATRELERVVGDGALMVEKCEIHNRIVASFRGRPGPGPDAPDGDRVAMLLDWTVTPSWRGAPEVFWYADESHVDLWSELLGRALPVAADRLTTATLDRTHPALHLLLA